MMNLMECLITFFFEIAAYNLRERQTVIVNGILSTFTSFIGEPIGYLHHLDIVRLPLHDLRLPIRFRIKIRQHRDNKLNDQKFSLKTF